MLMKYNHNFLQRRFIYILYIYCNTILKYTYIEVHYYKNRREKSKYHSVSCANLYEGYILELE